MSIFTYKLCEKNNSINDMCDENRNITTVTNHNHVITNGFIQKLKSKYNNMVTDNLALDDDTGKKNEVQQMAKELWLLRRDPDIVFSDFINGIRTDTKTITLAAMCLWNNLVMHSNTYEINTKQSNFAILKNLLSQAHLTNEQTEYLEQSKNEFCQQIQYVIPFIDLPHISSNGMTSIIQRIYLGSIDSKNCINNENTTSIPIIQFENNRKTTTSHHCIENDFSEIPSYVHSTVYGFYAETPCVIPWKGYTKDQKNQSFSKTYQSKHGGDLFLFCNAKIFNVIECDIGYRFGWYFCRNTNERIVRDMILCAKTNNAFISESSFYNHHQTNKVVPKLYQGYLYETLLK